MRRSYGTLKNIVLHVRGLKSTATILTVPVGLLAHKDLLSYEKG
jgi:hypothetical protein